MLNIKKKKNISYKKKIFNYENNIKIFGFWIYLMSDIILFSTLLATYFVLKNNSFNVIKVKNIFNLFFIFIESIILLISSFTFGLSVLNIKKFNKFKTIIWLITTIFFGSVFVFIEIYEFLNLFNKGYCYNKSAFLSSYFTLIGMHGLHIIIGIIWIIIMIIHVYINGFSKLNLIRFKCLSLFWHLLDIIWIVIFTFVYLIGVL
ncbi:MAG: cytochrome c oxidase subunit 3 [Candidatus Makana argininalis]